MRSHTGFDHHQKQERDENRVEQRPRGHDGRRRGGPPQRIVTQHSPLDRRTGLPAQTAVPPHQHTQIDHESHPQQHERCHHPGLAKREPAVPTSSGPKTAVKAPAGMVTNNSARYWMSSSNATDRGSRTRPAPTPAAVLAPSRRDQQERTDQVTDQEPLVPSHDRPTSPARRDTLRNAVIIARMITSFSIKNVVLSQHDTTFIA